VWRYVPGPEEPRREVPVSEDTTPRPIRQSPRIVQLNEIIEDLRSLHPKTKDDPPLERKRSVLIAHAYAVRDTLVDLQALRDL